MKRIELLLFIAVCGSPVAATSSKETTSLVRIKDIDQDRLSGNEQPKTMRPVKTEHDLTQRRNRRLIGRHVCAHNKVVMQPIKDMQSYCKPSYRSYLKRCDNDSSRYCTGYRVAYEVSYRTVQRLLAKTESVYTCCPGWSTSRTSATDCKKAICREECKNGGICTKPDRCTCPEGWTGRSCETDVDECSTKKDVCHHSCINVPGSYKCECEDGYNLQHDKKSCKKIRAKKSEVSDDYEKLSERIKTLEQRMSALDDVSARLDSLSDSVQQHLNKKVGETGDDIGEEMKMETRDQIDSLSDQIAILEERLAECACNKRDSLDVPRSQKR